MELSSRLHAVVSLVTAGHRVVDIGTDHAYIPIYLMKKGLASKVIAMDVNMGPMKKAEEHVAENGMSGKIELRLSDGFEKLKPLEAESAVLAGMGGPLMIRILKEYPEVTLSLQELVLQPQSEIAKVRAFLLEEGFLFIREDMVKDDGKYYPMMKVVPPHHDGCSYQAENEEQGRIGNEAEDLTRERLWSETEVRYGKLLLEMRHPVLREFLKREYAIRQKILSGLERKSGVKIRERRTELEEEMGYIRKGLEYYAM